MRYFGQPRHTGDQQCDMCGCWVHGERMHLAGGWALVCEGCKARADRRAGERPENLTEEERDWYNMAISLGGHNAAE